MLMRFDPFREFDRITQALGQAPVGEPRPQAMAMDAYREGDRFLVMFDLPGVDPASTEITVEKNVLTVRAERPAADTEGREEVILERPRGSFVRQLFLGESLDADHLQASYDRGVLTLTIPVAPQAKPRRIAITASQMEAPAIPGQSETASAAKEPAGAAGR
jgi:HSP20 family protein